MEFYKNNEGKLTSDIAEQFGHWADESPTFIANNMGTTSLVRLLSACGGDTSKLTKALREAVGVKARLLVQEQEKFAERRREEYQKKSAAFHNQIMDEIRKLYCGSGTFTVTTIQLAASKNPDVITRSCQMYNAHLRKELGKENPAVQRVNSDYRKITYYTKDGREKTRIMGWRQPSIWEFID